MSPTAAEREITRIRWYALRVPLDRTISDAHATLTHWTVPVVEVGTADGRVGTGIGGIHHGAELLTTTIATYYAPLLLGRDSSMIRSIWHQLYDALQWIGRAGVTHLALGMVDIALWDLAAQRCGQPLWRHLGGRHERVHAYNTDGGWLDQDIPSLTASLSELVDQGWDAVKIKVGSRDWREDVRRTAAARQAVGDDIELSCDANKVWDLLTAQRFASAVSGLDVAWLEEPMHPDDVAGHAALQATSDLPIACGESLYSSAAFRDFVRAGAMRIAQPDVTRLAGITEYLDVAAFVGVSGLDAIPHAGDMAVVHQHLVAASQSGGPRLEYLPWTQQVFVHPVRHDGPWLTLPEEPGASTAVRTSARDAWTITGTSGELDAY